jgi:hypothetical protein
MSRAPNWDDLQRKPAAPAEGGERSDRFDELCAQIFSVNPGAELLALLHARHVDKRSRPGALEAHLREEAAFRNFVLDLESARDKGLAAAAKASVKPA